MTTATPPGTRAEETTVAYRTVPSAEKELWQQLHALLRGGAKRWCDVGGGEKPVFKLEQIEKWGLDYVVLDASQAQLDKAPRGYRQVCADILDDAAISAVLDAEGPFDVVVSRWTAEHIPDPRRFHESIYRLLAPGGHAVHFFPTLYSLPFLANRLLPEILSSRLLFGLYASRIAKFRPYYRWCYGPTDKQLERLESVGFSIRRYVGYFGHNFYRRIAPLHALHRAACRRLAGHPVPALTSFALVVLVRPP